MSNSNNNKNVFVDIGLFIALAILTFYIFSYAFQFGYFLRFNIPMNFLGLDYFNILDMIQIFTIPFFITILGLVAIYFLLKQNKSTFVLSFAIKWSVIIFTIIIVFQSKVWSGDDDLLTIYFLIIVNTFFIFFYFFTDFYAYKSPKLKRLIEEQYKFSKIILTIFYFFILILSIRSIKAEGYNYADEKTVFPVFGNELNYFVLLAKVGDDLIFTKIDEENVIQGYYFFRTESLSNREINKFKIGKLKLRVQ